MTERETDHKTRSAGGYNPEELQFQIKNAFSGQSEEHQFEVQLLGRHFLHAAANGFAKRIEPYLEHGMPVNFQESSTGQTALHVAASSRARKIVKRLVATGEVDFLIRDRQGRLASEHANLFGRDPVLARYLGIKERKQADAQGIRLTRRPEPVP